jgi:protein gp37
VTHADLKQHPLSAAFPPMTDQEFSELRTSIATEGLDNAIMLYDGMVLDGWHRQTACVQTGAKAKYDTFEGDFVEARAWVVRQNLKRRHLSASQRGQVAEAFTTIQVPGRPKLVAEKGITLAHSSQRTVADVAELFNISPQTVKDARVVRLSGDEDKIAAVQSGSLSVSKAAKQVRQETPKFKKPPAPAKVAPLFVQARIEEVPPVIHPTLTIKQWEGLDRKEQAAQLAHRNPGARVNPQKDEEDENRIDWAKWTWNPITGCLHNCPYCYARDIAERFSGEAAFPNGFAPTFRADRLSAPLNSGPRPSDDPRDRRIFTGSMSDIFGRWVPAEWVAAVLNVQREASHWEFLMLTKFPKRMSEFEIPGNVWMGTSIDCQARVDAAEAAFARVNAKVKWISAEPLIEPLHFKHLDRFNLLVLGGASPSSKTPRWIPPFSWLDDLMHQANEAKCAVYLKSNLYLKEEPGGSRYIFADRAPDIFHYLARASGPDQKANAA